MMAVRRFQRLELMKLTAMKLIFDCRFIRNEHHDGISRFSTELFSALAKQTAVVALISDQRVLKWLPADTEYIAGNSPTNLLAELGLARKLNKLGATHIFSPMQTMGALGKRYKLVLTLHDLIYYSHPKAPTFLPVLVRIAWRIYHWSFTPVRLLLNRADAVVTVSETSKDLIERHRLTSKAVHVIYNAPESLSPKSEVAGTITESSRNKLVYMGSFMEYKNVELLVQAMNLLPEYELVLLSRISKQRESTLRSLAGNSESKVTFRDGVSDLEYANELAGAFALVSASKDEGFGIPLVEAMEHGIPLVLSDIPIFREIGQDAALYFDPSSPEQFAKQIRKLEEKGKWGEVSSRSRERGRFFDWNKSATKLLDVLRQL
jgi:glycosyltransferase involved in cell wall biosynthesis